jgi:hypothetical protein
VAGRISLCLGLSVHFGLEAGDARLERNESKRRLTPHRRWVLV